MLAKRVLVAVILLPIGVFLIYLGGAYYFALIALTLGLATWEYTVLFRKGGYQPAAVLSILGVLLLVTGRWLTGFESAPWMISLIILAGMIFHLFAYEKGRDQAATDFAITLSAIFYFGWIGAYLISLRFLPDGMWWVLTILPSVWLADTGAYFIGKKFGRHKITRRLSPKKSWEGYFGGIFTSTIGTYLLVLLWQMISGYSITVTPTQGAVIGMIMSAVTIFGDLGESMIKRQVGEKDSGTLLPGHGGVFDRIDSWLWAAVIGYSIIIWLF